MITGRDESAIRYIQQYRVARTSTLTELFYPSYSVGVRRLREIAKTGEIQRERNTWDAEYIYFVKRPKQLRHAILLTDFYRELSKQADIFKFIVEPKLDGIRPDAAVGFTHRGVDRVALVEVELSNKGFDVEKYKRWNWKEYFDNRPELIIISDGKIPPTGYGMIKMKTDLKFKL